MTQHLIRRFPFSRLPHNLLAEMHGCQPLGANLENQEFGQLRPSLDLHETADAFIVEAELPGVAEKDVKIELRKNVLKISGELHRKAHEEGESKLRELRKGSFLRALALPSPVNHEEVVATMESGILEIRLPKQEPTREVRVIPVGKSIQTEN